MTRERRTNIQQQLTLTTIASFSANIYPTNTIRTLSHPILHRSVTYGLHASFQYNATIPSSSTLKIHPTTTLISPTTHQEMNHILLYSLSHITQLSSIPLYIFLSSNPAQPVLSLNSNLTLSWPCTYLIKLSTPVLSFANIYHFKVVFPFPSSVHLISCLILFFNLPTTTLIIQFKLSPQNLTLFTPSYSSVLS